MSILHYSSMFVMRELVQGAMKTLGGSLGEAAVQTVSNLLNRQLTDHGQRFLVAFRVANDRAWRALEIALSGDSWWDRLRGKLTPAEDHAFAAQVRQFLSQARLDGVSVDRQKCLAELRDARKRKLLETGSLASPDLTRQADELLRYRDPAGQIDAEMKAARSIANALRPDYQHLAAFLHVQVHQRQGESLLAVAVRYFFRRAVEEDAQLARGLDFVRFEKLHADQELGFAALNDALNGLAGRLEGLLGEVHEAVKQTHEAVLDIQSEQRCQGDQMREMYQVVIDLQRKFDLSRAEVRPADSLSIKGDEERQLVKQLVARYRSLPVEHRRQLPALLNGIGKLEVAAGDFHSAEQDFRAVAQLVRDPQGQGEAYHNAYRAALERRDWDAALRLMRAAVQIDAARFAPFPFDRYDPVRILGGGGFGVAFLCEHRQLRDKVVVKSLFRDHLDRGTDEVLNEARLLWKLDHPSIIRVSDCGYADPAGRSRPYVVMPFFEGETLEALARREPLPVEDFLVVARLMAEGLLAAHERGVLHRDVKPANVLLRPAEDDWEVKLIDFGLAVRQGTLDGGIAGTIDYAAPEQMGRLPGVAVSVRSDIYSFGKTCCFALFGRATPLRTDWQRITKGLADVLESCLQEHPNDRPADADQVLYLLSRVRRPRRRAGAVTPAVIDEAGRAFEEAELLLSRLRASFESEAMVRLMAVLRRLREDNPGERQTDLVRQARELQRQTAQSAGPAFSPGSSGPLSARPDSGVAPALAWDVWLSLWQDTRS